MFGGLFEKLKEGLTKTRGGFTDRINETLSSAGTIDEDLYEEIEEILITSDIGVETSLAIIEKVKENEKIIMENRKIEIELQNYENKIREIEKEINQLNEAIHGRQHGE